MADPIASESVGTNALQSFGVLDMIGHADVLIQLIMLGLVLASFYCWAIIYDKIMRLKRLKEASDVFEREFWSIDELEKLYNKVKGKPSEPMAAIFVSAMNEWRRANIKTVSDYTKEAFMKRLERVMDITLTREMDKLERGVGFLASIGSAAPFIGLFGTVWGIMNAFTGIAATQNTSLAAVAPGIAEALLVTAIGLFAAIPAVIGYNKISSEMERYAARLETFSGEFAALVSRQLDDKDADKKKVA